MAGYELWMCMRHIPVNIYIEICVYIYIYRERESLFISVGHGKDWEVSPQVVRGSQPTDPPVIGEWFLHPVGGVLGGWLTSEFTSHHPI